MRYFHFTETSGRDKREHAFSAKDENEFVWFLNEMRLPLDAFKASLELFRGGKGGGFAGKVEGRSVSLEAISRNAYEQVKSRRLQNALAGL